MGQLTVQARLFFFRGYRYRPLNFLKHLRGSRDVKEFCCDVICRGDHGAAVDSGRSLRFLPEQDPESFF